MRKFICFCLVFLAMEFAYAGGRTVQASTISRIEVGSTLVETAPLPPPTATSERVVASLNEPFTLHVRQWATLRDTPEAFGVQLAALGSDSRCPAGVNCVVAGQVEFMLRVRTGNVIDPQEFHIGAYSINGENKVRYGGYAIELLEVQPPAPPPDERLKPSAYTATLVVRRDGAAPEPITTPTVAPTATPAPQDDPQPSQPLALNQPFSLQVGETATIHAADLQVTLRSVSEESGCLTPSDCSLMLAEGTLVLQKGERREVLTFNASFTLEQPFDYEFAGYTVQLVHLKKGRDGQHLATFVVRKPTPMVAIPRPQWVERCPLFSRFDAAAILQEEVAKEAVANLVFGPIAPDASTVQGMCGYVTTAFSDDQLVDEQTPHLASAVPADRAAAATVFPGSDSTQLLQLAHLIAAADPAADLTALLRLQAQLTAGFYDNVLNDLTTLAEATEAFTVSPIQGIGDEGLWLWQRLENGYFALLIIRHEETFSVVTALLNDEAEEELVLDYMVMIVRRFE